MGSNLQVQCQKRVSGGKGDEFFEVSLIVAYGDAYVTSASAARFVDYLSAIGKCMQVFVGIAEDPEPGSLVHGFEPGHVLIEVG
jgi:hypothetical protein